MLATSMKLYVADNVPTWSKAMGVGAGLVDGAKCHGVPIIVFHGDADRTVHVSNGNQVLAQAEGVHLVRPEVTTGRSSGGTAYTRSVEKGASGKPALEHWLLHGAGHAWSGGHSAGSYTSPEVRTRAVRWSGSFGISWPE